ncbi:replication protein RepA [Stenotrophomonas oahuensis]|uniref:Replication protein RepA n=1 Tax=Stenotrophomonas oahuensis TaxID=3003271 RepID=A0ABY9YV19_9GAMM|nr:replication protein RepA [Stenotrophomonas sp. A5586]WNH54838.1 replication protein RepA [Stenotrophomonas sp. A5586]
MTEATESPTGKGKIYRLTAASTEIRNAEPEGDDIAFLLPTLCHVAMPRSRQVKRVFERHSGTASLRLEAGALWDGERWIDQQLPYGTKPRLLLLHIVRSYLRTQDRSDRTIDLGRSAKDFLENTLGINASGGRNGGLTGFREQMNAFAACRMLLGYSTASGSARTQQAEPIVQEFEAWPSPGVNGGARHLWPRGLRISEKFADSIAESSVPLDMRAIRVLQNSALSLDQYSWLAHRLWRLRRPQNLYWANLRQQFGEEISDPKNFRRNFLSSMQPVLDVYPQAKVSVIQGGIQLRPSPPPVPKKSIVIPFQSKTA